MGVSEIYLYEDERCKICGKSMPQCEKCHKLFQFGEKFHCEDGKHHCEACKDKK
jgi:hypothetical protein